MAKKTSRAADAAEKGLVASSAPLITFNPAKRVGNDQATIDGILATIAFDGSEEAASIRTEAATDGVVLAVRIRNIGPGPALIGRTDTDIRLRWQQVDLTGYAKPSVVVPSVVAPGEGAIVYLIQSRDSTSHLMNLLKSLGPETVTVVVRYANATRTSWWRSSLTFELSTERADAANTGATREFTFVDLTVEDPPL
jgi:hypothetical protein